MSHLRPLARSLALGGQASERVDGPFACLVRGREASGLVVRLLGVKGGRRSRERASERTGRSFAWERRSVFFLIFVFFPILCLFLSFPFSSFFIVRVSFFNVILIFV